MDDDELVNKVAKAIAKQSGFTTAPGVKPYFKHARAALQVVKEAGWTPQIKVRQVTRSGPDFSDAE